ncbi:MAG TPA: hypothetical protein VKA90_02030 [Beijerinckiaceae bacterium]|jgi:hypothetical protein|nr:hypothetical protein [Beijerinckiaceae bacterium]
MSDQETRGAIQPAEIVRDDHPAERRPERPPVAAFDPHFGSLSGGGRESSEFDEMMWESAA